MSRVALLLALAAPVLGQAPRVVSLSPQSGSLAVDPSQYELRVVFDRNMDPTITSLLGCNPSPPRVLEADWDNLRTFWLRTALQPDTVYALQLAATHGGRSRDGLGLTAPVSWRFATAPHLALDQQTLRIRNERCLKRLSTVLRERYAYRDRLGVDWDDRIESFGKRILAAPSGAALCLLVAEVLEVSKDPHVAVRWGDATIPAFERQFRTNYDLGLLPASLPTLRKINDVALTGRTADGIGYLMLATFATGRRRQVEEAIDALRELRGLRALVIDVRPNTGGDEHLARQLAAWCVHGTRTFALRRTCDPRAPGGLGTAERQGITGNAPPDRFDGPIAVLTGRANLDACESFLLMMRQGGRVSLVGDRSFGSSGHAEPHDLIPGLHVLLPRSQLLLPDGIGIEGQGIAPDLNATWSEGTSRDRVLDQALDALRAR